MINCNFPFKLLNCVFFYPNSTKIDRRDLRKRQIAFKQERGDLFFYLYIIYLFMDIYMYVCVWGVGGWNPKIKIFETIKILGSIGEVFSKAVLKNNL